MGDATSTCKYLMLVQPRGGNVHLLIFQHYRECGTMLLTINWDCLEDYTINRRVVISYVCVYVCMAEECSLKSYL